MASALALKKAELNMFSADKSKIACKRDRYFLLPTTLMSEPPNLTTSGVFERRISLIKRAGAQPNSANMSVGLILRIAFVNFGPYSKESSQGITPSRLSMPLPIRNTAAEDPSSITGSKG